MIHYGYPMPGATRQDPGWLLGGIQEAVHEQDVHTVIASRCLRVLNPWAIIANADSLRRVA